jgi:DNA-binding transcriptional ArsR family regulator
MEQVAGTAAAIGDPVRRELLDALRGGPETAGALARRFPISRPAVSRHLRVLRERGLVVDELRGRERVYRVEPAPFADLEAWLARFRAAPAARFEPALDALATEVHRAKRQRATPNPANRQERTA